jgi:chlorobactene glucosyltransferase
VIISILLSGVLGILVVIVAVATVNMLGGPFLANRRGLHVASSVTSRGSAVETPLSDSAIRETSHRHPSVVVCIPARNEARNIGTLLELLRTQTVAPRSILVLDDHSHDETASIVAEQAREDARIHLLDGASLPPGWTGKNWACHQLAKAAEGDVLLFVDADVRPGRRAIEDTLDTFDRYHADAVSAFPQQLLVGTAAAMIIPVMDLILYGFLPLPLVHRTRATSLAAANGQWFGFRREMYRRIGGHAAVRDAIVEDVTLARAVKRVGGRLVLAVGKGSVACRMYERFGEIREGFSKNFFAAFGFNTPVFLGVLALFLTIFVLPFGLLFTSSWAPALLAVLMILLIRGILAWGAGHSLVTVLLHPFGVLAAVLIGLDAIRLRYRRGAVRWKGRDIVVDVTRKQAQP